MAKFSMSFIKALDLVVVFNWFEYFQLFVQKSYAMLPMYII